MTSRKPAKPRTKAAAPGLALPDIRAINAVEIKVDQRAQSRAALDAEAVSEYAQAMRDGAKFPPLVVFHDGEAYWLAEGFHRLAAPREAELESLVCEVCTGSLRDAILHSAGANATHGLRRSNADKRRAVLLLLEDEEWSTWADREIARRCAVDNKTVARLRDELSPHTEEILSVPEPRTYQDRHGNVTQMWTAAIGRRLAETPEPEAPAETAPAISPCPVRAAS